MKTIAITGAASGIGAATAALLERDGHKTIGIDLNPAEGCSESLTADLASPDGRRSAIEGIQARQGVDRNAATNRLIQDGTQGVVIGPAAELTPITRQLWGTKVVLGMDIVGRIMKTVGAESANQQLILIGNQNSPGGKFKM